MADTEDEVTLTKRLVAETSTKGQRQQKRRKKQSLRSERVVENVGTAVQRHGLEEEKQEKEEEDVEEDEEELDIARRYIEGIYGTIMEGGEETN